MLSYMLFSRFLKSSDNLFPSMSGDRMSKLMDEDIHGEGVQCDTYSYMLAM